MKKSLLLWITLFAMTASILTACSGAASPALVGNWKLASYGSPTNLTPVDPNVDTSLTFGSDGTLNGNVGCNSFNGNYKVDGNTVTFGPINSTLMACPDPMMEQEGITFIVFTKTATFKMDGNTLTVTSGDGQSVVVLEHK